MGSNGETYILKELEQSVDREDTYMASLEGRVRRAETKRPEEFRPFIGQEVLVTPNNKLAKVSDADSRN